MLIIIIYISFDIVLSTECGSGRATFNDGLFPVLETAGSFDSALMLTTMCLETILVPETIAVWSYHMTYPKLVRMGQIP